jgi:hypothetical protein
MCWSTESWEVWRAILNTFFSVLKRRTFSLSEEPHAFRQSYFRQTQLSILRDHGFESISQFTRWLVYLTDDLGTGIRFFAKKTDFLSVPLEYVFLYIKLLPSHVLMTLQISIFLSDFPIKTLYAFLITPCVLHVPASSFSLKTSRVM